MIKTEDNDSHKWPQGKLAEGGSQKWQFQPTPVGAKESEEKTKNTKQTYAKRHNKQFCFHQTGITLITLMLGH